MNTLILTKPWYTLQLFKSTKKFFEILKSTIYQFIWQKKTPRLRKDTIFLHWVSGGLKVHDPALQHCVLQKRWLNYLIDPVKYPSFVYKLMLQHLSLFDNASLYPHFPLYDADYRCGTIYNSNMSIWTIIFFTFDYFIDRSDFQLANVPIETILAMPLHKILVNINESHWTRKHPSFKALHFLIFDPLQ
jgi:hypothetical protein